MPFLGVMPAAQAVCCKLGRSSDSWRNFDSPASLSFQFLFVRYSICFSTQLPTLTFFNAGGAWLLFLERAYQQIFGRWENFEMGRFCALFWRRLGSEVVENVARQHLFEQPSHVFLSYICVGGAGP